jgi:hypothetical protein
MANPGKTRPTQGAAATRQIQLGLKLRSGRHTQKDPRLT